MKISRNSFVYKTAYVFTDEYKRPLGSINGCNLFWRFIFFGWLYLAILIILYPLVFLVNLFVMVFRWIWAIFFGRRLELYQKTLEEHLWPDIVLNYIWAYNWRSVPIESWPRIFGWRILPIGILGVLAVVLILTAVVFINWDLGTRSYRGDYSALGMMLGELLFVLLIVCGLFASRLRQSVPLRLLFATMKSFKDRTCPVVEIV